MRLPIQTQIYLYKKVDNEFKFLILKRIASRGGFWQAVTGGMEEGETLKEAALREVAEETGIIGLENIDNPYYVFQFEDKGYYESMSKNENFDMSSIPENKFVVTEYVFAIEVNSDIEIDLSKNIYTEHSEYKWCSYEEALELMKYDSGKEALKKLKIIKKF